MIFTRRLLGPLIGGLVLIASARAACASGRPTAAVAVDDGWLDLPRGFIATSGRILLQRGGAPIHWALEEPSWDSEGWFEASPSPGLRLRFHREGVGKDSAGMITALLLEPPTSPDTRAFIEVELPGFTSPLPVRLEPDGSEDVVFLGLEGSGGDIGRGFVDGATGRKVDLGGIFPALEVSGPAGASGKARKIRVEGRIPRGREIVLLSFQLTAPASGGAKQLRSAAGAASQFSGWLLEGSTSWTREALKLAETAAFRFGTYVEAGDGWQGRRAGRIGQKVDRDWLEPFAEDSALPATRQSRLADGLTKLRELGVSPALWIAPHGQSTESFFRQSPEAFVRDEDGKAIPDAFLGPFVVDGTSAAGLAYLDGLFTRLRRQGVVVFRLGGLREVLRFYEREKKHLKDPSRAPMDVLKATIVAVRTGTGDGALLAGDWETPSELAGALDAARPSDGASNDPLRDEGLAAAQGYYRHRNLWFAECFPILAWAAGPGEAERRAYDQSRILFGALTGRGFAVDHAAPLPSWGLELLEAATPPEPVRPIDLFPSQGIPRVWDLKLPAGGDLVGLFNWAVTRSETVPLSPRILGLKGLPPEGCIYFDVLEERFVGAGAGEKDFLLLPGRSRFLAIHPDRRTPQIVALGGRYLATASQIEGFIWDANRRELRGEVLFGPARPGARSLRIHIACGPDDSVAGVVADDADTDFSTNGGHLRVTVSPRGKRKVPLRIKFTGGGASVAGTQPAAVPPLDLAVALDAAERRPLITWRIVDGGLAAWRRVAGFAVLRDGKEIGRTTDTSFLDTSGGLPEACVYSVAVLPSGSAAGEFRFTRPATKDAYLEDWTVEAPAAGSADSARSADASTGGSFARSRSAAGGPLVVGGKKGTHGLGMRAPASVQYRLDGLYETFEASVGVDDASRFEGTVVFVVTADGAELLRTELVRGGAAPPVPVRVSIAGKSLLTLTVEDAGDGASGDLADWLDARVKVSASP